MRNYWSLERQYFVSLHDDVSDNFIPSDLITFETNGVTSDFTLVITETDWNFIRIVGYLKKEENNRQEHWTAYRIIDRYTYFFFNAYLTSSAISRRRRSLLICRTIRYIRVNLILYSPFYFAWIIFFENIYKFKIHILFNKYFYIMLLKF